RRAEAEARRAVAVDLAARLDAVVLLVGVDVGHRVVLLHRLGDPRRPEAQPRQAAALQRVLVGRVALPAAGPPALPPVPVGLPGLALSLVGEGWDEGDFSSHAHIIGVVVSEITSEISTAAESVTANSRKRRPTCPCMKRSGMNTATSERLIESTVKPTSRAP